MNAPPYPNTLINYQSHIALGVGPPGLCNGIVLIMTEWPDIGCPPQRFLFIPGTVVPGRSDVVVTSLHGIIACALGLTGNPYGRVKVWAMRADQFSRITPHENRTNIMILEAEGAVPARQLRYTRVPLYQWARRHRIPDEDDFTLVELEGWLVIPEPTYMFTRHFLQL